MATSTSTSIPTSNTTTITSSTTTTSTTTSTQQQLTPTLPGATSSLSTSFPTYRMSEVSLHCTSADAWVVIDSKVYDVSKFRSHPGGFRILERHAGKNATDNFNRAGHRPITRQSMSKYQVGVLDPQDVPPTSPSRTRRLSDEPMGLSFEAVMALPVIPPHPL